MTIQTDSFSDDFLPDKRVVSAAPVNPREEAIERALRPKLLQEYVGQAKVREQLEIFLERYFKYDVDNIYRDGLLIMFRNWTTVHSSRELVKQSIPSEHLELFKRRAMNEQCVLCGKPLPDVFFTVKLLHVATGEILTHNYCVPCKHS